MSMKKRIRTGFGLQQGWLDIQKEGSSPEPKNKPKKKKNKQDKKQQPSISLEQEEKVLAEEESHTFDGKEIYS